MGSQQNASNNNESIDSNKGEEIATKVLGIIIGIAVLIVSYLLFVNSSAAEAKLFGFISFRLPFETTEHFCSKEATTLGFLHESDKYYDCIMENGNVDEGLQAWWQKGGITDKDAAKCAANVTKKYLTGEEIEVVLGGQRIDRIPDLYAMMSDLKSCAENDDN